MAGLVALTALEIDAAIVATSDSDPDDIRAYLDQIQRSQAITVLGVRPHRATRAPRHGTAMGAARPAAAPLTCWFGMP